MQISLPQSNTLHTTFYEPLAIHTNAHTTHNRSAIVDSKEDGTVETLTSRFLAHPKDSCSNVKAVSKSTQIGFEQVSLQKNSFQDCRLQMAREVSNHMHAH